MRIRFIFLIAPLPILPHLHHRLMPDLVAHRAERDMIFGNGPVLAAIDALLALTEPHHGLVRAREALAQRRPQSILRAVAVGVPGMALRGIPGGRIAAVLVGEGADAEDAAQQGPAERDVGDEDGGGELADVPVQEDGAVRDGEVVVSVEDRREDDKASQAEDTAENEFPVPC